MTEVSERRCRSWRFFCPDRNAIGQCRRHAPRPGSLSRRTWPLVAADHDWSGKHEPASGTVVAQRWRNREGAGA